MEKRKYKQYRDVDDPKLSNYAIKKIKKSLKEVQVIYQFLELSVYSL